MRVFLVGAGAVGTVAALKFADKAIFESITIADIDPERAAGLCARLERDDARALAVDADDLEQLSRALQASRAELVLHAGLPRSNLVIMRACLANRCHYMDLASGSSDSGAEIPSLEQQFALDAEFERIERIALLGIGADPGTSNIYAAYAAKHLLDEVSSFHVRDGDSSLRAGQEFLPTFSPWVFIDECLCRATVYRQRRWHLEEPLSGAEPFNFPELGLLTCYFVDHEESSTLPRFFPQIHMAEFKYSLDDVTVETLRVLKRLGLHRKEPIEVRGAKVVPRALVCALLPDPGKLGGQIRGRICVGTVARGKKNGLPRSVYIYNVSDHEKAYAELGVQATSYQTGIPPVLAAELIAEGVWSGAGVLSPEQLDPDPFLERLPAEGMPWYVREEPPA
ncbi:MAG TPA: saccharopine dehydrogenase C-terminal domain-containing protein [Acidobacteriota bacterium]